MSSRDDIVCTCSPLHSAAAPPSAKGIYKNGRHKRLFGKVSHNKQSPFGRTGKGSSGHDSNVVRSLRRVSAIVAAEDAAKKKAAKAARESRDNPPVVAMGKRAHKLFNKHNPPAPSSPTPSSSSSNFSSPSSSYPSSPQAVVTASPQKKKRGEGVPASPPSQEAVRVTILTLFKSKYKSPAKEDWIGAKGHVGVITQISQAVGCDRRLVTDVLSKYDSRESQGAAAAAKRRRGSGGHNNKMKAGSKLHTAAMTGLNMNIQPALLAYVLASESGQDEQFVSLDGQTIRRAFHRTPGTELSKIGNTCTGSRDENSAWAKSSLAIATQVDSMFVCGDKYDSLAAWDKCKEKKKVNCCLQQFY